MAEDARAYYATPAPMTALVEQANEIAALPDDVPGLVQCIQGLILHQFWAPAYGIELSKERSDEVHIRPVAAMLKQLRTHDPRPLTVPRALDKRLISICRHFSVLLAALLRAKGVPARARCGFATYFEPARYVDHWLGEYWNRESGRWVLVDAQLDDLQCSRIKADFDRLDVPRDRFLVGGDAWALCRAGNADPECFGIFDLRGLWFVASNLLNDLAALNKCEMLPWDVWGPKPRRDEAFGDERLVLFDRIAALTRVPGARFDELRGLYCRDARLQVPERVFNAVRERLEPVFPTGF